MKLLEFGLIELSFSSSDNPTIPNQDHILLAQDSAIDLVNGRFGATEPLVPVAISLRVSGYLMSIKNFNPNTDRREIEITGLLVHRYSLGMSNTKTVI